MSRPLQDIAVGINGGKVTHTDLNDEDKALLVESKLNTIVNELAEVSSILENKADLEFLLMVVGSYIIGCNAGTIESDAQPPNVLFETVLLPAIREFEERVEKVEEEEDGSKTDS